MLYQNLSIFAATYLWVKRINSNNRLPLIWSYNVFGGHEDTQTTELLFLPQRVCFPSLFSFLSCSYSLPSLISTKICRPTQRYRRAQHNMDFAQHLSHSLFSRAADDITIFFYIIHVPPPAWFLESTWNIYDFSTARAFNRRVYTLSFLFHPMQGWDLWKYQCDCCEGNQTRDNVSR